MEDEVTFPPPRRWLLALFVALVVSSKQWRFFDCNKAPVLSFLAGVVTVLVLYGVGEATYRVASSEAPRADKLWRIVRVLFFGAVLFSAAGFFATLTHLCP